MRERRLRDERDLRIAPDPLEPGAETREQRHAARQRRQEGRRLGGLRDAHDLGAARRSADCQRIGFGAVDGAPAERPPEVDADGEGERVDERGGNVLGTELLVDVSPYAAVPGPEADVELRIRERRLDRGRPRFAGVVVGRDRDLMGAGRERRQRYAIAGLRTRHGLAQARRQAAEVRALVVQCQAVACGGQVVRLVVPGHGRARQRAGGRRRGVVGRRLNHAGVEDLGAAEAGADLQAIAFSPLGVRPVDGLEQAELAIPLRQQPRGRGRAHHEDRERRLHESLRRIGRIPARPGPDGDLRPAIGDRRSPDEHVGGAPVLGDRPAGRAVVDEPLVLVRRRATRGGGGERDLLAGRNRSVQRRGERQAGHRRGAAQPVVPCDLGRRQRVVVDRRIVYEPVEAVPVARRRVPAEEDAAGADRQTDHSGR